MLLTPDLFLSSDAYVCRRVHSEDSPENLASVSEVDRYHVDDVGSFWLFDSGWP